MMKLNPPDKKKTSQEVASRNGKATLDKSLEKNISEVFSKGRS